MWDPTTLPSPHEGTIELHASIGALPGVDAEERFAATWDPREDYVPRLEIEDKTFRESERGIDALRHPEAVLRESPRLWDVISKWRSGVTHELTRADYARLTNFEIECWLTMIGAHNRETERRLKHGWSGDGNT